jgi:N-acetylmuramoyl-L-alanine amidase
MGRWAALPVILALSCAAKRPAPVGDGGALATSALLEASARALGAPSDAPDATHDELRALAKRVGEVARSEGATSAGILLATAAGELEARAYRVRGGTSEPEALAALEWWSIASARGDLPEACRPAILRAHLAGEIAHDPAVGYRALLEARDRLGGAPCLASIDAALDRLSDFRPSPAVASERAVPKDQSEARIVRVSHWSTDDTARVILELDRPIGYTLDGASTLRVRLDGVALPTEARIRPGNGLLREVAFDAGANGELSVEVVAARPAHRRVFFLPDPFRIVLDLATRGRADESVASGPRPLRRVVLDPGHGGADPGAIGPTGLREKEVTLSIAKLAAPLIARDLGAEVRLTRGADVFVDLEQRTAAANAFEADAFVSIHCNAAEARGRRGLEIYVLDTARDDLARRVATRENGGASAGDGELRAILGDLKLAELGPGSRTLATLLGRATMASVQPSPEFGGAIFGGVHGAGFFVLVGARMPAVLIEAAFISNPVEEAWLAREDYRARIADGIVNALRAYKDGRS